MTGPFVRSGDPDTSHEAAAALTQRTLSALQAIVAGCLRAAAPQGLTTTEISDLCQIPRDTLSPRMPALRDMGLVVDSGERRKPLGMRRNQIVWKAVPPPEPAQALAQPDLFAAEGGR